MAASSELGSGMGVFAGFVWSSDFILLGGVGGGAWAEVLATVRTSEEINRRARGIRDIGWDILSSFTLWAA